MNMDIQKMQTNHSNKLDIHNFTRRLELLEAGIQAAKISEKDRENLFQFRDQCFADGLGVPRVVKYLQSLKVLCKLSSCAISDISKMELISLLARIEQSSRSAWTKHDYKLALRKYLIFCKHKDLADLIKISSGESHKLPEELLSSEDIRKLLSVRFSMEDKVLISCLWESGCRVGELLGIRRKHVQMDQIGAVIILDGKTGMRRLRIIESAALLDQWISEGSFKQDQHIFQISYAAFRKRLQILAHEAGIEKRIYPHLFRHSRATFLAGHLTESQLKQFFGWNQSSNMAAIYVHLNGADLDITLTKIPSTLFRNPESISETPFRREPYSTDLEIDSHRAAPPRLPKAASPRSPKADVRYGKRTMAVLYLLKEHPEGLTVSESSKLLKDKYHPIQIQIYRNLKYGNLRKDGLKYFLTSRGCLTIEEDSPIRRVTESPIQGVTESPNKITRPKGIISGFTVELYEFVKNNEGLTAAEISQHFGKKNDFIRPYLHRLKDYGYLINDNGRWKTSSIENLKTREKVIESNINIYPSGQSFGFSASLPHESKATV